MKALTPQFSWTLFNQYTSARLNVLGELNAISACQTSTIFCGIDGNFEEAKLIQIYFDMDLTEAVNATKKRGERATLIFLNFISSRLPVKRRF